MNIPPKIREYYKLCATKLGSRKLPAENMSIAPKYFSMFFAKENGDTIARETIIGGGGNARVIVI